MWEQSGRSSKPVSPSLKREGSRSAPGLRSVGAKCTARAEGGCLNSRLKREAAVTPSRHPAFSFWKESRAPGRASQPLPSSSPARPRSHRPVPALRAEEITPRGALRNRLKGKAGASSGSGSKGEGRPRAAAGLAGLGDAVPIFGGAMCEACYLFALF